MKVMKDVAEWFMVVGFLSSQFVMRHTTTLKRQMPAKTEGIT
jgi:hypothetical protein